MGNEHAIGESDRSFKVSVVGPSVTGGAKDEDEDQGEDMEGCIVSAFLLARSTSRPGGTIVAFC